MSSVAGLSTTIGAGVVLLMPGNQVKAEHMSFALALAGGVMITTTVLEFWLPVVVSGSWRDVGRVLLYSGLGAAAFMLLERLVPHSHSESPAQVGPDADDSMDGGVAVEVGEAEGLVEEGVQSGRAPTSRPSAAVRGPRPFAGPGAELEPRSLGRAVAGDLDLGAAKRAAAALEGARLDQLARRWRLAMVLMLSLTAHNFPEGLAVAVSALESQRLGLVVMVAIAMHNIPEGIAISVPVLAASGSRWKALWMTFLSGMTEPLGAIVALGVLGDSGSLSVGAMEDLLCAVGGVMVVVSVRELLPEAWAQRRPAAFAGGLAVGLLVMLATSRLGA